MLSTLVFFSKNKAYAYDVILPQQNFKEVQKMPLWIAWLQEHWLATLLVIGVVVAIVYVIANKSLLFYKE